MPATLLEVQNQTTASNANYSVTLTSALDPTDLIVIIASAFNSVEAYFDAILLVQYRRWVVGGSSGPRMYVFSYSGATGTGHTVTIDPSSFASSNGLTVLVVRGLEFPTLHSYTETTFYSIDGVVQDPAEVDTLNEVAGPIPIKAGQVGLLISHGMSATGKVFPYTPTPATGWVTQTQQYGHQVATYIASADGEISGGRGDLNPTRKGIVLLALGGPPSAVLQIATPVAFTSGSIEIRPLLAPTDLVVVIYSRGHPALGTVTIDGGTLALYGEWTTAIYVNRVFTITGLTGLHTVSYSTLGGNSNIIAVYVLRSLINPAITANRASSWDQVESPIGTLESTPTAPVGPRQIVLGLAVVAQTNSTITWPASPTPPKGWFVDRAGSTSVLVMLAHRNFAEDVPAAQIGVHFTHATAGAMLGVLMLVAGDPEVVTPPAPGVDMGGTWGG